MKLFVIAFIVQCVFIQHICSQGIKATNNLFQSSYALENGWKNCRDFAEHPKKTFSWTRNGKKQDKVKDEILNSFDTLLELLDHKKTDLSKLNVAINHFVTQFVNTNPGKILKNLLKKKDFANYIRNIWFGTTEAFRHVFVGDIRRNRVAGFHNWIQFNQESLNNQLEILRVNETQQNPLICKISFNWRKARKIISTFLIGRDPAYELALYTLCFQFSSDRRNSVRNKKNNIFTCQVSFGNGHYGHIKMIKKGGQIITAYFV